MTRRLSVTLGRSRCVADRPANNHLSGFRLRNLCSTLDRLFTDTLWKNTAQWVLFIICTPAAWFVSASACALLCRPSGLKLFWYALLGIEVSVVAVAFAFLELWKLTGKSGRFGCVKTRSFPNYEYSEQRRTNFFLNPIRLLCVLVWASLPGSKGPAVFCVYDHVWIFTAWIIRQASSPFETASVYLSCCLTDPALDGFTVPESNEILTWYSHAQGLDPWK